ncbi:MAG: four helix bundle protein [Pirellulales bacterium]|nr:four helix bundle protein [Pirellulales bacterium]
MKFERYQNGDLRQRTKRFALRIIRVSKALDGSFEAQTIRRQMLRSGTSVGAHYREATRARSNAEFVSKIEGGMQELDETSYWMELLIEGEIIREELLSDLLSEANELMAIFVTIVKNLKD